MKKLGIVLLSVLVFFSAFAVLSYTVLIPFFVSTDKLSFSYMQDKSKHDNIKILIQKPLLKTGFSSDIAFKADNINIKKNGIDILTIDNPDVVISLSKILKKDIIIKKLGADNIFADVNKIVALVPQQSAVSNQQKNDWNFDLYDSVLYLNNSYIKYTLDNGTDVELKASDLNVDNTQKIERFVHFNFDANLTRNKNTVHIAFKDEDKIVIKNKHLYVNDCPFIINYSKMFFNADASRENGLQLNVYAKRFFIPDVIKLLQTDVIENSINEPLEYLKNINGDFDFNLKINKDDLSGVIKINKLSADIFPLSNMPFDIFQGEVVIKGNDIVLNDFKGFYDKKISNEFSFEGTVKDYLKAPDTNIDMITVLSNDFVGNYLSKTAGVNFTLTGSSKAKLLVHSKNNDIDVTFMGKVAKGNDILVEGSSLSPVNYDRAVKAVLHIKGDDLNIETINYYIAQELNKNSKGIKPILSLNGDVRLSDAFIYDLGFNIPNPLPSEFLNVLIGQKLFKGGKFSGELRYIVKNGIPYLDGKMNANSIRIPSQRLSLKNGEITTDSNLIKIKADGRYRRCSYIFNGYIINKIIFPIVVKHTDLTVDNVDIVRIMKAFTSPVDTSGTAGTVQNIENEEDNNNDELTFDFNNLIIEDAVLKIIKGSYKEINFANVEAKMSFDKDNIFKLKSNRFEIAEGHSSADVNCDLNNQKYNIKLGIKDVNSDVMSTAILNLPREISGKASGLIDINTDETLKLNGAIKFIIKNGTIQKIGLVEYVLKFASLFRNPLAMISPTIFSDLVNIPEGNFDKITGDMRLKDNRIELMKIKSYSPTLSAYIVGCYNLENSDAIMRIYTKFSNRNKGIAGVLRHISLNALANRIPLNNRNDSNYYAAELEQLPEIEADEKDCQIFLTKVDGDLEHNNFISSLKKIK